MSILSPRPKTVFLPLQYCTDHTTPPHPVQTKLLQDTMKHRLATHMGAPEVISLNVALMKAMGKFDAMYIQKDIINSYVLSLTWSMNIIS